MNENGSLETISFFTFSSRLISNDGYITSSYLPLTFGQTN